MGWKTGSWKGEMGIGIWELGNKKSDMGIEIGKWKWEMVHGKLEM